MNPASRLTAILFGVLIGVNVTLVAVLVTGRTERAWADTALEGRGVIAVSAAQVGGQPDAFYVLDTASYTVAIYTYQNDLLSLKAVRDITYDVKLTEHGKQSPSVREVYQTWKEAEARKKKP